MVNIFAVMVSPTDESQLFIPEIYLCIIPALKDRNYESWNKDRDRDGRMRWLITSSLSLSAMSHSSHSVFSQRFNSDGREVGKGCE